MQRINTIITNECQEQPPTTIEKFPRKQLFFQKGWYHTWTSMFFGELFGCCHNLQLLFWDLAEKYPWTKIYRMENCLSASIFTYQNVVYYIQLWICFAVFSKSCGSFQWSGLSISIVTNIMNNSVQFRDRELQLLVLFMLIILECVFQQYWNVLPVFVFWESCKFGKKIHSKFVKPWEM